MSKTKPSNVQEYFEAAPAQAKEKLEQIRKLLKKIAPNASEEIKYGHPVFVDQKILFAYSAHKSHMNFLLTDSALLPFSEELKEFVTGKDSIQIPYNKPFPDKLIQKIAEHRIKQLRDNDAK